jgi:protein-S-isoprenylcysteine O-methyltransferase Ste14
MSTTPGNIQRNLPHRLRRPGEHPMAARLLMSAYGALVYLVFLLVFVYAILFVEGLLVPKGIDDGIVASTVAAIVINLVLLTLFALQHSVMARPAFKRWWTQFVPWPIERSTYVLFATAFLALLLWQWRPLPDIVWQVDNPGGRIALYALSFFGWGVLLLSTFLIDHFDLFGLRQVLRHQRGAEAHAPHFQTPMLYRLVRHPLYLGFIIAFWAAPTMTVGHLLFAAVTTAYIVVAIQFEEHDLITLFGERYREYRHKVPMLIPWRGIAGKNRNHER